MKASTIWCIGRNYIAHANEMGNPLPNEPLVFMKSVNCIADKTHVKLPENLGEIHFETELVLKVGDNLEVESYCIGQDLTARDIQNEARKNGQPWTLAKSFKNSCLLSPFQPINEIHELDSYEFTMFLNGVQKQHGKVLDMIFIIDKILMFLKQNFPLAPGDIIMTGTPAGVGKVTNGDQIDIIDNRGNKITWNIL